MRLSNQGLCERGGLHQLTESDKITISKSHKNITFILRNNVFWRVWFQMYTFHSSFIHSNSSVECILLKTHGLSSAYKYFIKYRFHKLLYELVWTWITSLERVGRVTGVPTRLKRDVRGSKKHQYVQNDVIHWSAVIKECHIRPFPFARPWWCCGIYAELENRAKKTAFSTKIKTSNN